MAFVDDGAVGRAVDVDAARADEKARDLLDRLLRRRQADAAAAAARRPAAAARATAPGARRGACRSPRGSRRRSPCATVRSISRLRSAVSSRYSDSGVVTRMCGGVRSIAARSDCGVSPVRTAAVMRGASSPIASASCADAAPRLGQVLVDVGAQRLERRDVDDAHFVGQRAAQRLPGTRSSSAVRNAASVLPEPVGAAISVWRPLANRRPAAALRGGRLAERVGEPAGNEQDEKTRAALQVEGGRAQDNRSTAGASRQRAAEACAAATRCAFSSVAGCEAPSDAASTVPAASSSGAASA